MLPFARSLNSLLVLLIVITGTYSQCNAPSLASATPVYNATSSNEQLVIYCSNVILPATYLWQYNGDVIENAVDHVYVASVPVAEGIYRCGYTKTTCAGTIWSNDIVTVINKPSISLSPTSHIATVGNVVTLQCSTNGGYPTPSITWYNGTGGSLGHTANLTITAVTNDTFTCIAVNSAGYASGSITVTVNVPIHTSSEVQQSTTTVVSHYSPSSSSSSSSLVLPSTTSVSSFIAAGSSSVSSNTINSSTLIGPTASSSIPSSSLSSTSPVTTVLTSSSSSSPSVTMETTSTSLTTENIFGLVVTIVFLVFLLASVTFFFAVFVYWFRIVRRNRKIRRERKAGDRKILLDEDLDQDKTVNAKTARKGGVPPSSSYVNEGFKQDVNDSDEEEKEKKEEEEESEGDSLTKVRILPRVTLEPKEVTDDNGPSPAEHYVIVMEKKQKEENANEAGNSVETDEDTPIVQVVPIEVSAEIEANDNAVVEAPPPPGDRDQVKEEMSLTVLSPEGLKERVRDFETHHLQEKAKESILGTEYNSIPMLLQDMSIWPPETYSKNRYRNVIPNKETAVILSGDTAAERYINANYINGYNGKEKAYICAQAPIYDTIPDYWKMVWENNVNTVVMLCGVFEGGKNKCAKYWPSSGDNDTEYYGPFTVRNNYEEVLPFYKVIYLSLSINEEVERDVMLFVFQGWPDFGVPEQASPMLEFHEAVSINHTEGPLLVHCSAGVGRSGSYIALDIGVQQYTAERTVDIYGWTVKLREQRGGMIQSFDQYAFVHIALATYISRNP